MAMTKIWKRRKATKEALFTECKALQEESLLAGKTTPACYPSWSKVQMQQYIKQMKSGEKIIIAGTVHGDYSNH